MTLKKTDVHTSSEDTTLLATCDVELAIALLLQQDLREVSNFAWNSLVDTDAYLERSQHKKLIERLEAQSKEADALKVIAESLVKDLRIKKRKLTRKLKSNVHSIAMEFAREAVRAKAQAAIQKQIEVQAQVSVSEESALEVNSVEKSTSAKRAKSAKASI